MTNQPASSQVAEVTASPGQTVRLRTGNMQRIAGHVVGPEHRAVVRDAVPVYSEIHEYQDSIEEYRAGIADQIGIDAHRERGRLVCDLHPRGIVYLDVSGCNHIPRDILGSTTVDTGMGDRTRVAWEAWLVSVERIDTGDPMTLNRMVAGYRVALREGGDA